MAFEGGRIVSSGVDTPITHRIVDHGDNSFPLGRHINKVEVHHSVVASDVVVTIEFRVPREYLEDHPQSVLQDLRNGVDGSDLVIARRSSLKGSTVEVVAHDSVAPPSTPAPDSAKNPNFGSW